MSSGTLLHMEIRDSPASLPIMPRRANEWKTVLRELGITPSRQLGQNFLVDMDVLADIVATAGVNMGETVVEVGPGLGVLTAELAAAVGPTGHVVAVELDRRLAAYLPTQFVDIPHVRIVSADILRTDPLELTGGTSYVVVANLPYKITSAAFRFFLEHPHPPERLTTLVQREVAERIVAAPPEMSVLAISVQFFGTPQLVRTVPPEAFVPRPAVTSAVLTIARHEPLLPRAQWRGFFALVQAGFGAKRKQLHNSLTDRLRAPREAVDTALAAAGVDGMRRAQTLTLDEWLALYAACTAVGVPLDGAMGRRVGEGQGDDPNDDADDDIGL